MRVTEDDALSLLGKYAEQRKPVLALLVTPSLSVARAMGTIHVSIMEGVPRLLVGEEDNESKPERIKFRLSDCIFEYGDFREANRDEDSAVHKYEGFLVIRSNKGGEGADTLTLFEPKS